MPKAQISASQRLEIIALKGSKSRTEVADLFGIKPNYVDQIWHRAAHPPVRIARAKRRDKMDPQAPVIPDDDPITTAGVLFMELEERHCRWPIGKDAEGGIRFCACERMHNKVVSFHRPDDLSRIVEPRYESFYCEGHDPIRVRRDAPEASDRQRITRARYHRQSLGFGGKARLTQVEQETEFQEAVA